MQRLTLCALALMSLVMAAPGQALECANAGAVPTTAPDDTTDGNATACGGTAVAGGVASTALGYLSSSGGVASTALGYSASSFGDYSTALGYDAFAVGGNSIAFGRSAWAFGPSSVALGQSADSAGGYGAALGYDASSAGDYSTALGYQASSVGTFSTAGGHGASSAGTASTALGSLASSGGHYSIALGREALAAGAYSTALGYLAQADQPDTVILGAIAGVNSATISAKVGIGTTNPAEAVDVERSAAAARFQLTSFTATASEAPQFIQRRARGTRLAPTAVQSNDNLGLFSFRGYNGSSMGGSRAAITAQAAGTFSASSTPTRLIFSTTPVGKTAPESVLVITPDGKVQIKGVNLNVPDYVFEDDYELMPPNELRTFIDRNGHLPGIANAQQINSEGLDLAGSQMGLLQKVEELTLYMLEQESRLDAQQERIEQMDSLQERVAQLEAQLTRALAALD